MGFQVNLQWKSKAHVFFRNAGFEFTLITIQDASLSLYFLQKVVYRRQYMLRMLLRVDDTHKTNIKFTMALSLKMKHSVTLF